MRGWRVKAKVRWAQRDPGESTTSVSPFWAQISAILSMGCSINALSFLRYENKEIVVGNAMG